MKNEIRSYLEKNRYPSHVVDGGHERLLKIWKRCFLKAVEQNNWTDYNHLNEIASRRILSEIEKNGINFPREFKAELQKIDLQFKEIFSFQEKCILGEDYQLENNLSPSLDWWYFGWPKFALKCELISSGYLKDK